MEAGKHLYTSETIFHFTCYNCKNWWSYATSSSSQRNITEMSCPHCGLNLKTDYNYLEDT